jgi:hypothetical protein
MKSPMYLLHCSPELSVDKASENLLSRGDNLLAYYADGRRFEQ